MVNVITFEAPYSPIWNESVLHSLVYSAIEAANEAPVILRSNKEWAEAIYKSELFELFVDYLPLDAPFLMDMKPFEIRDGELPEEIESIFRELMEAQNANKGLFK